MGDDLATQIVARIIVIAFGVGIAWFAAQIAALIAPSLETPVFAGIGSIWVVIGVRRLIREIRFQRSSCYLCQRHRFTPA
jgi:hypothetical protein